jgi:GNAT superfamily N-acetyltransferase
MIRLCTERDFDQIFTIINDGARAYQGIIPPDRLEDPYMSREKLQHEIADGVIFWGYESDDKPAGALQGVMGIQSVAPPSASPVTLIRHAYVRTGNQKKGIGGILLTHLRTLSDMPFLIGTWADAVWAIRFYQRHGFQAVEAEEKDRLLKTYWNVPARQIETSVVLADQRWRESQASSGQAHP